MRRDVLYAGAIVVSILCGAVAAPIAYNATRHTDTPPVVLPIDPELVVVTDETGKRIDDKAVETVAGRLDVGTWRVQAIPKPGYVGWVRTITVADGLIPTPPPVPPTPPTPPVPPLPPVPPGPVTGMRVLIVENEADRGTIPRSQLAALTSSAVRSYCTTKNIGFRQWDGKLTATNEDATWQAMLARPRASMPWVVIFGSSAVAFEGPLPADESGLLTLLKKYGGP